VIQTFNRLSANGKRMFMSLLGGQSSKKQKKKKKRKKKKKHKTETHFGLCNGFSASEKTQGC